MIVDGDYVVLHVASTGREPGVTRAIIDIFRLDAQNKIVEHWDVIQTVPEKPPAATACFEPAPRPFAPGGAVSPSSPPG